MTPVLTTEEAITNYWRAAHLWRRTQNPSIAAITMVLDHIIRTDSGDVQRRAAELRKEITDGIECSCRAERPCAEPACPAE